MLQSFIVFIHAVLALSIIGVVLMQKGKGADAGAAEHPGDEVIPWAVTAAAAAMGKDHDTRRPGREFEFSLQFHLAGGNNNR